MARTAGYSVWENRTTCSQETFWPRRHDGNLLFSETICLRQQSSNPLFSEIFWPRRQGSNPLFSETFWPVWQGSNPLFSNIFWPVGQDSQLLFSEAFWSRRQAGMENGTTNSHCSQRHLCHKAKRQPLVLRDVLARTAGYSVWENRTSFRTSCSQRHLTKRAW